MLGCHPTDAPIKFNCKLGNSNDQVPVDKEQYQRLVGKLIYLPHTRPDIFFAVSVVSQFMQTPYVLRNLKSTPYEEHMNAINKILRNLKSTPGKMLMFRKQAERPLRHTLTWIGQDLLLAESLPPIILPLFGTIL